MSGGLAYASSVDESIVDTSTPTTSVTLAPGATGNITLNLTVTGNQNGTASFKVDRDWTLAGGTFTGSNPAMFTVAPRAAQDQPTILSTTGTLTVASDQPDGTFTLAAAAFDITNSNSTGAKLAVGSASSYAVTVKSPAPTNTKPTVAVTGFTDGASYELGVDTLPTAMCSVTDKEDGSSSFAAVMSGTLVHGLGTQTATCDYTDKGGLAADTATASYSIVDTTDPTITHALSDNANANGWFKDDVTVTFTCADEPGSGIQSCLADGESGSSKVFGEGADQSASGTATDWAGNTARDSATGINVDKTAPSVSLVDGPADDATYYYGFVPTAPTCSATDGLSGLDGDCAVSGYSSAIGQHTVSASAADKAGNTGRAFATYTVETWTTRGFFSPVNMGGVWNTVKGGSTVPLKFELFAGSTELTDTSLITGFTVKKASCDTSAPTDDVEFTTTGGTSLRYDSTAGQFVQNWKTPTGSGCYAATMTANDGSTITAYFKTK